MFGSNFNGILINRYSTGQEYIGQHSDDEKNLDKSGVIAISYRGERIFRIRDKVTKEIVQDNLVLDHNIIEYIYDNNTCDNELDEWLQMINDYQTTGRIV
jgi:hypothetical protein